MIDNFANSLKPYYTNETELLDAVFADIKREELLLILLQIYPTLNNVYFNFGIPEKIDLEKFMIENFRFNVNLERFAFLTGRSLSTFKRDFIKIFGNKPRQWLTEKRLNEAYFLIKEKKQKPIDIYLNLGFENLSHFSFAFKKKFKKSPNDILNLNIL
ncbi:Virulence regulon transcriptional activator VirF [compost metagenome]